MAETTVLNIDFGDTLKRLQEIRAEITDLSAQNKGLHAEMDKIKQTAGAYSNAMKILQEQLKNNKGAAGELVREYQRISDVIKPAIQLQNNQRQAFKENRSALSAYVSELENMGSTAEQESKTIAKITGVMAEHTKALETAAGATDSLTTHQQHANNVREDAQMQFNETMSDLELEKHEQTLETLAKTGEEIAAAEEALYRQRLQNREHYNEAVAQNDEHAQQQAAEQERKALEDHQRIQQAKLDYAQSVQGSLTAIIQLVGSQGAAAAKFQKALTLFQIGIDTAKSISTTVANATQAASAAGPGAPFVLAGYISSGIATVLGALVQAKQALSDSKEPKAPKLAQGGEVPIDVGGKPHSAGGTMFIGDDGNMFEVERGEKIFVLRKTASDFINRYSTINQLFGGNSWTGKPVTRAALGGNIATSFDGGLTARNSRNNVEQQLNLAEMLRNLPAPVVRVTEINRVQGSMERNVGVSEL